MDDQDPYQLVCEFVVRRRHELGLNQYELAAAAGVSKGLISMLEASRSPNIPKVDSLVKLAQGLRIDPEILLELSRGRADFYLMEDLGILRMIPSGVPAHILALGWPVMGTPKSRLEPPKEEPVILVDPDRVLVITDEYVDAPYFGRVGAGNFLVLEDHPTEPRQVLKSMAKDGDGIVDVFGDSMTLAGIYPGMSLVVRHQNHADPGDIVLASVPFHGTVVKRLEVRDDGPYLVSQSLSYHAPIKITEEVQIVGVAQHAFMLRRLKN
jgi:SOS-response transcriptional repressor LexA